MMRSILTIVLLITLNYLTPLFAQYDTIDSDSDGVPNIIDLDDDNDGILDTYECYQWAGLTVDNINDDSFDDTESLLVRPSDFGLPSPPADATGVNVTRDFSSLYGLPEGSIIVTVSNATTLSTYMDNPIVGGDIFYVTEDGGPVTVEISGTYPVIMQVEFAQDYDPGETKSMTFPSGGTQTIIDASNISTGIPADMTVTQSGNTFSAQWGGTGVGTGLLLSKQIDSYYSSKIVEFDVSDDISGNNEDTAIFFRFKPICDFDNDGIPDMVDLDSDNDGCLDAVEGATDPSATDFPGSIPDNDELVNDYLVDASGDVVVGTGSDASNQNLCGGPTCAAPATDVYPGVVLNPTPGPHSGADIYWYQHVGSSQNAADIPEICSIVMPVEFVYFSAKQKDQSALLEWATALEYNNSHFEIERSIDGNTWQLVTSIKGAGFTSTVNNYRYTDSHVAKQHSLVYYRVKQVDFDGQSSYTNMASVTFELHDDIKIYPNPVIDLLHVDSQRDETIRVELYDVTGRMVLNTSESIINVSNQFNGLYTLRVYNDNGQILKSERVIISK